MELTRQRRTKRPLVVWLDDQMPLLLEQVGHLNLRGFDVQPTDSVTGFLGSLQNQSVNIVIIDIRLGGPEDGRTLVDLIYESRPEIGIVVHSSFPDAFLSTRYDGGRVRFVTKDPSAEPVKPDDGWPLADTLRELVDVLNERQKGLLSAPAVIGGSERKRRFITWSTVHGLREFATEHLVLAIVVGLLILKIVVINPSSGPTLETVEEYLLEISGFLGPFAVAIFLAWWKTPGLLAEAGSREAFVQMHFEEIGADREFRDAINKEFSRHGIAAPREDFSVLIQYYDLLDQSRLWLARLIVAIFVAGTAYLIYDIGHDLWGLWLARHVR